MVDKSNEYGYVPSSPTQASGSNTGVFEVNDIVDLLNAGQWSLQDLGKLELIETQNITSSTAQVDFEDLGTGYNVHLITVNNLNIATDSQDLYLRVLVGGVEQSGVSDYGRAFQSNLANGTSGEDKDPSLHVLRLMAEIGAVGNEQANGYYLMYNALDSSKYTFFNQHATYISKAPVITSQFGAGVYQQANTLSGIRFSISSGNILEADISLYGINES